MAIKLLLSSVLILALLPSTLGASNKFNYDTSDTTYGPLGWSKTYSQYCNGSSQSPIDIVSSKTEYDSGFDKFTFTQFESVPAGAKIEAGNNGHSYKISVQAKTFSVSGGGLPATFNTVQFHFHWGSVNTQGSEHTVNGNKYPAEAHFVNYNTKYTNISEAIKHPDGIAVLGVIFEVGAENPGLKAFLKFAVNVTEPSSVQNLTMTHPLGSLLPANTSDFYRYSGSLTTPMCQEVVTWTVFKNRQTISANQLSMLRSLKENNVTSLVDTFRPVQPINSRVVKRSFKTSADIGPDNGAYHVTNTMTTIVSVVMAIVLLFK